MANALVIVPPFLKVSNGPLLGPAMLVAAGQRAGHRVTLADLNMTWIQERLCPKDLDQKSRFFGDHDRPERVRELYAQFIAEVGSLEKLRSHEEIDAAAAGQLDSAFGRWVRERLDGDVASPDTVGVSVMYAEQVIPALAITMVARRRWPRVRCVWGGAHVTALRDEIARDHRYSSGLIDGFVFGYAEQTWVDILDGGRPDALVAAGAGRTTRAIEDLSVIPLFEDIERYRPERLTIPMQSSRGCSYARCAFCTYPSIEGVARQVPRGPVAAVVELAIAHHAVISFKDSLVGGEWLDELADLIAGRLRWSACTKLDAKLQARLGRLARAGCSTLEIGLETLDPDVQRAIAKRQRHEVFFEVLNEARQCGVGLVVNYMTGFPNADRAEETRCRAFVEQAVLAAGAKFEHNTFQLERMSPMGRDPEAHGMWVSRASPWSSVLGWEASPRLVPLVRIPRV